MKNDFIRLLGILIGKEILDSNYDVYLKDFDKVAEEMNDYFNYQDDSKKKFITRFENGGPVLPVPFSTYGNAEIADLVIFGLNPGYDAEIVYKEKTNVMNRLSFDLEKYANYYTEDNFNGSHREKGNIFQTVLKGKYYTNLTKALFYLLSEDNERSSFFGINDIKRVFKTKMKLDGQITTGDIFNEILKGKTTLFAELIPFHSQRFSLNTEKLNQYLETNSSLKKYIRSNLEFILSRTSDNSIIICNGKTASQHFMNFITLEIKNEGDLHSSIVNEVFNTENIKIYCWRGRWIIELPHTSSTNGCLSSNVGMASIMTMISQLINGSNVDIEKCKVMLETLINENAVKNIKTNHDNVKIIEKQILSNRGKKKDENPNRHTSRNANGVIPVEARLKINDYLKNQGYNISSEKKQTFEFWYQAMDNQPSGEYKLLCFQCKSNHKDGHFKLYPIMFPNENVDQSIISSILKEYNNKKSNKSSTRLSKEVTIEYKRNLSPEEAIKLVISEIESVVNTHNNKLLDVYEKHIKNLKV